MEILAAIGVIAILYWAHQSWKAVRLADAARRKWDQTLFFRCPHGWDRVRWGQSIDEVKREYLDADPREIEPGSHGPRSAKWFVRVKGDNSFSTRTDAVLSFWDGILVGVNSYATLELANDLFRTRGLPEVFRSGRAGANEREFLYVWTDLYTRSILYETHWHATDIGFNFVAYAREAEDRCPGFDSPRWWTPTTPPDDFVARWCRVPRRHLRDGPI